VAERQFQRCLPAHKTGNYQCLVGENYSRKYVSPEAILMDKRQLACSTGNRGVGWQLVNTPHGRNLTGVIRNWRVGLNMIINQSGNNLGCLVSKGFEAIAYSNSVVEVIPHRYPGREARDR